MTKGRLPSLKPKVATLDTRVTQAAPVQRSGRAGEFSQWYTHSRWRTLRKQQLWKHPLCAFCEKKGLFVLATICDHIEPHKGDRVKFWRGPFQSLCKPCHDSTKKAMENGSGSRIAIGADGWPVEQPGGGWSRTPGSKG